MYKKINVLMSKILKTSKIKKNTNKKKCISYIIISMLIIIITLIIILKNNTTNHKINSKSFENKIYTQQIQKTDIHIYKMKKKLVFQLEADHIQYSPKQKKYYIIQPNITLSNKKNTTIWKITAEKAELNQNKILNLFGYIHIYNLKHNDTCLQSIITNQITINLITQNFFSEKKVIINGQHFYSIGNKIFGNLNIYTINLINNVKTYYKI